MALVGALKEACPEVSIIAEDLGFLTPSVRQLLSQSGLPGMRVLQFGLHPGEDSMHLPHNCIRHCVYYTGTHDNDTIRGWWNNLPEKERDFVRRYLSIDGNWIHWDLIRAAWSSTAALAMTPFQNILGLDSSGRMNTPGEKNGSWAWRFDWRQVTSWHASYLAEMTEIYGRTYSRR